jgi:hypothetical protein
MVGETPVSKTKTSRRKLGQQIATPKPKPADITAEGVDGSLVHIITGFLNYEESRVGANDGIRRKGTITRKTFDSRKQFAQDFLQFLNSRYGQGAVARMMLADLTMQDVEGFRFLILGC